MPDSLALTRVTPPWTLLPLIMPKFVVASYVTVTLVFGWRQAGASGTVLSGLIAVGLAPMLLSVFLAPIVDATMGPRRWWTIGVVGSLAALAGLIALPFGPATLTIIGMLVFVAYFGGYVSLLALDVVVTATVAPDRKGTANSWLMAGKTLGTAIGGGGGLWLAGQGVTQAATFIIAAAFAALCGLTLLILGADTREVAKQGVATSIRFLIDEALFDAVLPRIEVRGIDYWADPWQRRPGEISRNDGGRGVYFPDPDGHHLEVITRPYGGAS